MWRKPKNHVNLRVDPKVGSWLLIDTAIGQANGWDNKGHKSKLGMDTRFS